MELAFALFVVLGLGFHFVASLNSPPAWAEPFARGCWLVAGLIWAIPKLGIH